MQVLCLDFDDTIYIHEHIPEMFDVYEMVQGFMDPLVLNDMLNAGVPHRYVFVCLFTWQWMFLCCVCIYLFLYAHIKCKKHVAHKCRCPQSTLPPQHPQHPPSQLLNSRFLLCLVDSMLASGRDVFIVSFGRDEWVLPAAAAVFGDRIPENHIFTRSNEPNGIEPPDKTVWLWEIAAHCGVAPHQVWWWRWVHCR